MLYLYEYEIYIYIYIGRLTGKLMDEKDKRVKLMSEIIRGIRVIKYQTWEKYFVNKVSSMLLLILLIFLTTTNILLCICIKIKN